ncbi:6-phosphogluconolactonase [Candidatus Vallotia tarda]|uniref:6-phosphogluconolactonase n=1 Tax=Candidatus Vallotiella hemipterorum TaxID=1177213 RepID=A0A916JSS0_9BURK|nr:6-phosphogluconolactonase [Candidatus Vallotia tarda]CAG7597969.1 6-phosphogluconolactonase [Candidatus Vallotia tarda]
MIGLHVFNNECAQRAALVQVVSNALQSLLITRIDTTHVTLAVSGGISPRPFLKALSQCPLNWARINVTLVDDRWVPPIHPESNARLVRDTLLQNAAREAIFQPLVDIDQVPNVHVKALNKNASRTLPDVAVLGMGEDGHIASIFADAPQWDVAILTGERYILIQPRQAPYLRISLSLSALKKTSRLFLLISGQRKLDVLRAAMQHLQHNAISKLANDMGVNVDAYWCA